MTATMDRHETSERDQNAREWSLYDRDADMDRAERERYDADTAMDAYRIDMLLTALSLDAMRDAYR